MNIFENTFIKKIKNNNAYYDRGIIKSNKIIIATHFPFINSHGFYFLKMYQHRSYTIAFNNSFNLNGMFIDENKDGFSFRNYKDMLLIGGGGARTGKDGGNYTKIRDFAKKYYPDLEEKFCFATQDCMTLDSIPYIGRYSKTTPNLFVATGFNKWGMTSSMVAANILTDMIQSKSNMYEDLFDPSRSILYLGLLKNTVHALINLIKPTTPRCCHMGCSLSYNKIENTWDCKCHGSRYNMDGEILDNPTISKHKDFK